MQFAVARLLPEVEILTEINIFLNSGPNGALAVLF